MAILTFEQKHDFWKRPFNLSTQNLLCIEYGHLALSRHDLGKALSFFSSKIYSALYIPPNNAHGFAMRSMSLRDMQIPKSEKKNSWPPPSQILGTPLNIVV